MFYHSYYNKKSVESYLLPIPPSEALALPIIVEQTTSEAHADMNIHFAVRDLYKQHELHPKWYNPCLQGLTGLINIITPGTSTVIYVQDYNNGVCKIPEGLKHSAK